MQGVDPNANNIVGAAKMKLANGGGEADCFSVVRLEMQVEQELAGSQFTCFTTCVTSTNEALECWRRLLLRRPLRDAGGAGARRQLEAEGLIR